MTKATRLASAMLVQQSETVLRRPASWLRMLLLLGICSCAALLHGQTVDDSLEVPLPEEPGDTVAVADSIPAKVVKPHTEFLDPQALMNGGPLRRDASFKIEDVMYPDLRERLPGFAMSLGQWGMPYQRMRYGVDASNFETGNYVNPLTGAENVYFIDPERGMRYFDTRTPYLNAYYGQGKGDALQMRADISQNLHPLVNVAALYDRRTCKGVYTNLVTDHNTLGTSANFHTLNERYQVYGHFLIQQHDDQINGGVLPLAADSSFFGLGSQPVALTGANLRRLSRAVAMRQFFRITAKGDSAKHMLRAYNGVMVDYLLNQFVDHDIATSVNSNVFPVYPTLDSNLFYEKMELSRFKIDAGLTYRLNTPIWKAEQRLELAEESMQYRKNMVSHPFVRTSLLWKGHVLLDPNARSIEATWTYRQSFTNRFLPEIYSDVELAYRIPKWQVDYSQKVAKPSLKGNDSTTVVKTHRPISLLMHTLTYSRNPTLQQAFGTGWPGNSFVGVPNFNNRRTTHFSIGMELTGKDDLTNAGERTGNRLRLTAFSSRQNNVIYYAAGDRFVQAPPKAYMGYFGAELKLRVHLKSWFLETETVAQGFGTNSQALSDQFLLNQPKFYSKTSIFYDNRNLKFCRALRFGIDYWYFSSFNAPYIDPATQAFYAQGNLTSYQQFAYPRADVWINAHIKKVQIFVKFINLLEGLPQFGYYTTMAYPMQVRQLQLGLNWTFFD